MAMENLYPSLHARFKSEEVCPICLMEMDHGPKYSCSNSHTICHRCKPYYYSCPTCGSPLNVETAAPQVQPHQVPPALHFMPHPLPPSAPTLDSFFYNERQPWGPPEPTYDQELNPCQYANLGCCTRIPDHLRQLHESRCQFRSRLEENLNLPTEIPCQDDEPVWCAYRVVGCNVRVPEWSRMSHERICIYRDKFEALDEPSGDLQVGEDPEELVECKFKVYGCLVRMPRRRKAAHELKCNYLKYHDDEEEEDIPVTEYEVVVEEQEDSEKQVDCKWAELGCRVRPRLRRRETHEERCNYRLENCSFKGNGCEAVFQPSRRYLHERSCEFAG